MRRSAGDRPVLARGTRVPGQVPVLVPGWCPERGAPQRRARRRSLDGRVGRVLLCHESRFEHEQLMLPAFSCKNRRKLKIKMPFACQFGI